MLTGRDILNYVDCTMLLYEDLFKYKNIDSLLEKKPIVILYPTYMNESDSAHHGHWVCLWLYNGVVNFFDSYGYPIDKQLDWNRIIDLKYLSHLLSKSKYDIEYNDDKFQGPKSEVCGYYVIARLSLQKLSHDEFYRLFKKGKDFTSDEMVVEYVKQIL